MSEIVKIECSLQHRKQVNDHLAELQINEPEGTHNMITSADHLIHLGWMVSRLPQAEIENVCRMANEAMI